MISRLEGPAEVALHQLQDTELSPMEEALFRSWAKANQIKKPDSADDPIDYRGIYRLTGGKVLPFGQLPQIAKRVGNMQKVRLDVMNKMRDGEQSAQDKADQVHKEGRQDIQHQQRMEQEQMKLAKAPMDLESTRLKNEGKQIDVVGKQAATEQQKYKTEERLIEALIPRTEPMGMEPTAAPTPTSPTSEQM